MKTLNSLLLLLCCALLSACGGQEQFSYTPMSYAQLLRVQHAEDWTGVEVLDAWHPGQVLHRYVLVPRDQPLPDPLPEGTLVRTPLQRVVAFSSVHGGLCCNLQCADQLVGMCDTQYILLDSLRQRLSDGRLQDLGSSMKVDAERMMAVRPDAFFVSPFENAGYGVLATMNVPLVECADYMETSALGRAEWMKFYGMLMGREAEADSLFARIEHDYLALKAAVGKVTQRPSLLCDFKQGSAWYVPGGDSYIGRLFSDAGANYLFADKRESGSVAMSFENVYAKGREADFWVVKYGRPAPHTYTTIADDYPLYKEFQAWKKQRIYGCNTFAVPFYEEVPFHPDLLLKDMVRILHPELLPHHVLKYYQPIAE